MSARVLYTEIPTVETEEPIPSRIYGYKAEILNDSEDDDEVPEDDLPVAPTEEHPANLVSSKCADGMHRPALDIDVPVRLIPSSNPDHWHLYFPTVALDDVAYFKLLDALAEAGILGAGFVRHSKRRGATWLRLPHVKKEGSA